VVPSVRQSCGQLQISICNDLPPLIALPRIWTRNRAASTLTEACFIEMCRTRLMAAFASGENEKRLINTTPADAIRTGDLALLRASDANVRIVIR
jgi:hypothetical protein